MSGVALLGTLLREALPDAAVLDLTGHGGRVFAWCPGAWPGIADAAALPAAERALLGRFRQGPARRPVFGLDPAADAALLAGAPAALAGASDGPLLLALDGPP
ncbi:hypothetical protein E2C05_32410, partial [Paracraurococcus ruber]|uniref:hypothetical protein n=1 Tax=Paracraurococcus ruber TaxID=77675 RepID=UPI001961A8B7